MTTTFDEQRAAMTERIIEEALERCRSRAIEDETASRLMSLCRDAVEAALWARVRLALAGRP